VPTRPPYFGVLNRHSELVPDLATLFLALSRALTSLIARCPTRHQYFGAPMWRSQSVQCLVACVFGAKSDTDSLHFGRCPTQHPHVSARFGAPSIRCPCSGTESGTNSAHLLGTRLDTLIWVHDLGLRVLGFRFLALSRARTLAFRCPTRCEV